MVVHYEDAWGVWLDEYGPYPSDTKKRPWPRSWTEAEEWLTEREHELVKQAS